MKVRAKYKTCQLCDCGNGGDPTGVEELNSRFEIVAFPLQTRTEQFFCESCDKELLLPSMLIVVTGMGRQSSTFFPIVGLDLDEAPIRDER